MPNPGQIVPLLHSLRLAVLWCRLQKQESIDSVIKVLAKSSAKSRKILLIELFGILLADGSVCDAEAAFMDRLAIAFNFEDYQVRKIHRWVEAMNDIVEEGYSLINKE